MNQNQPNSKQTATQVEAEDLLQFQLLSAYLGMRAIEVEKLNAELRAVKAELALAEVQQAQAKNQVLMYQKFLSSEYALSPSRSLNYASGAITQGNPHDPTNIENEAEEVQDEKVEG